MTIVHLQSFIATLLLVSTGVDTQQCLNQHRFCSFWARTGECTVNPSFMRLNCQLACGICTTGDSSTSASRSSSPASRRVAAQPAQNDVTCQDNHKFCDFWAGTAECQRNPVWMLVNCRLSCSQCDGGRVGVARRPVITQTQPVRNDPVRCAAILSNSSNVLVTLRDENLVSPREVSRNSDLSSAFANSRANSEGCIASASASTPSQCSSDLCYNLNFRTHDGSCNNLQHPEWGTSFQPFIRLLDPVYDDGAGVPVGALRDSRPSARDVVRNLLTSGTIINDNSLNLLVMQWGQFIAHDMSKTSQPGRNSCPQCTRNDRCFPAPVQRFDPMASIFGDCIRIQRDHPTCGTNPREQFNENTAFIDGSQVYGSTLSDSLRFRDAGSPFLRTDFAFGGRTPPFDRFECPNPANCPSINFQTGDDRSNIFATLAVFHILFVREHNRVANILRQTNPQWDGDRVYQEARKVVGAEMQAITYNEYLPKIFGTRFNDALGSYRGYQPDVNPTIANVFSTAALRFGHGMLTDFFQVISPNGASFANRPITFADWVEQSVKLRDSAGIDTVIRGLMLNPLKRPQRLAPATQRIFGNRDLGAINLQRGRDHGLPSYNAWREFCKLPRATTMQDLASEISNSEIRRRMQELYNSPDNVDLYAALLLEDPVPGALVGPTLICLLGQQFRRLRDGDRLFYRSSNTFTNAQLAQIERTSFARIICDNADAFQFVAADAFRFVGVSGFSSCQQIAGIDFRAWRE